MKRLLEEFRKLKDYRKNQVAYTNPSEILFLSLLAVISGANSFEDMSLWMKERKRVPQEYFFLTVRADS